MATVDYRCPACEAAFTRAERDQLGRELHISPRFWETDLYCPNCCRAVLEPRMECPECGGLGLLSRHERDAAECNRCMGEGEVAREDSD